MTGVLVSIILVLVSIIVYPFSGVNPFSRFKKKSHEEEFLGMYSFFKEELGKDPIEFLFFKKRRLFFEYYLNNKKSIDISFLNFIIQRIDHKEEWIKKAKDGMFDFEYSHDDFMKLKKANLSYDFNKKIDYSDKIKSVEKEVIELKKLLRIT